MWVPGETRPHITVMRPEAVERMRDHALVMHSAVRGHTQESRDSHACADRQNGGVASLRDAVCNTTMTTTKTYGAIPIRNAQHLTYLYLFNPALNKYMLYNKMISESQGLH